MSGILKVDAVAKHYGRHPALHPLSFSADRGEIIALLGRNGAGKSTLMNILAGYIAMTQGCVSVAGYDLREQPLQAGKHIGYLPEQPPLYPEITVTEYLRYCAELKGIPRRRAEREIDELIERIGLGDYRRRLSGQLSKGYRQRLGLAQAMLGSPELLILDEPGSGLDPLQMSQMREVIRGTAKSSAVLLSSHILSEVTDMCGRAIVLDQGHCLYDGSMERLMSDRSAVRLVWRDGRKVPEALAEIEGLRIGQVTPAEDGSCTALVYLSDEAARSAAARKVLECGASLLTLAPETVTLESAFLHLISREETET